MKQGVFVMAMTRQHFTLIAATLKETKPEAQSPELNQWENMVLAFATNLRATNPGFKHDRFVVACGMEG